MNLSDEAYDQLRKSRYFQHLSDESLQKLLALSRWQCFPRGTTVLESGHTNQEVYCVISGKISVWVDGQFIYILGRAGDVFGEMSAITGQPSSARIEAHTHLEVVIFPSSLLHPPGTASIYEMSHLLYQWFAHVLSDKLRLTSQKAKHYEDLSEALRLQTRELETLNRQLHTEVEARRQAEGMAQNSLVTIQRQQRQTLKELEQARETQKVLLPLQLPSISGVRLAAQYVPMDQLGGDFYDVFEHEGTLGVLVADVTGHGISAALLSFMISAYFRQGSAEGVSPAVSLERTNILLQGKLPEGKFASLFYGRYDPTLRRLTYSTAGHPPGLLWQAKTQRILELKTQGMAVGMLPPEIVKYQEASLILEPGDKVLFYTDGVLEVTNQTGEMLGVEGLCAFLAQHAALSVEELLEYLLAYGTHFAGSEGFQDDVTLVAMEIREE